MKCTNGRIVPLPLLLLLQCVTHHSIIGSNSGFCTAFTIVSHVPSVTIQATDNCNSARHHRSTTPLRSNNDDNHDDNNEESIPSLLHSKPHTITRRSAVYQSLFVSTFLLPLTSTPHPPSAVALDLPLPFSPDTTIVTNDDVFVPAKRETAYLVDSSIPPTLVPFRAAREAAVLKTIGNGGGTAKTPLVQEILTTNNIMNKAVFGTGTFINDGLAGLGVDLPEIEISASATSPTTEGKEDEGGAVRKKKRSNEAYDSTFLFLGLDLNDSTGDDAALAQGILDDVLKPRRNRSTTLALSYAPLSTQTALDDYLTTNNNKNDGGADGDDGALSSLQTALIQAGVPSSTIQSQLPLLRYARSKRLRLLACAPETNDAQTVRTKGLQSLPPDQRERYVVDAPGFIQWTQDPRNKLYTELSLLKDYRPLSTAASGTTTNTEPDETDSPGGYFAERILYHETIATTLARHALSLSSSSPSSYPLLITVAPIADVRYMGGPNGRLPRVLRSLNPVTNVDEEAVTTVLLNPTAESTLSMSRFLRLEIGTAPEVRKYQTKVADYLWFSRSPRVNLLPRMMNAY